jgi:hypothetical protein
VGEKAMNSFRLIFLTFALVLFVIAGLPILSPPYEPWRLRLIALGLAALVIAQYPLSGH